MEEKNEKLNIEKQKLVTKYVEQIQQSNSPENLIKLRQSFEDLVNGKIDVNIDTLNDVVEERLKYFYQEKLKKMTVAELQTVNKAAYDIYKNFEKDVMDKGASLNPAYNTVLGNKGIVTGVEMIKAGNPNNQELIQLSDTFIEKFNNAINEVPFAFAQNTWIDVKSWFDSQKEFFTK